MRALTELEIELFGGASCVVLPCGADVCAERGGWRVTHGGKSVLCYVAPAVLCTVYDFCGCDGCALPCCAREGTATARLRDEVQARRDELDAKRCVAINKALADRDILRDMYNYACDKGYITSFG